MVKQKALKFKSLDDLMDNTEIPRLYNDLKEAVKKNKKYEFTARTKLFKKWNKKIPNQEVKYSDIVTLDFVNFYFTIEGIDELFCMTNETINVINKKCNYSHVLCVGHKLSNKDLKRYLNVGIRVYEVRM